MVAQIVCRNSLRNRNRRNLINGFAHLDTTSFSLEGNYEESDFPKITFVFSKDHRADLKQVILSLTTSGPSGFPVWMEALDGNSSDKTSFHQTIAKMTSFQKELKRQSRLYG